MREYEMIIDEELRNGLSPFRTTPFNSRVLQECLGFRLADSGLESYELKTNPLSSIEIPYSWPFPQVLVGERYKILVVRDSLTNHEDVLYEISDDMQTLTHIASLPELLYGKGPLMEMADFGEYVIITNGKVMVYKDPSTNGWKEITSGSTIPMMKTICNFKGQAVGGNVTSSWYGCDEKFYVWSKIGDIDFTPDEYNLAGFRRDPFGGEVYHVRRLGDRVIGYSSRGITLINPVSSPTPTFGFEEMLDIGLKNVGAVGGSIDTQVFVGEDNIVRRITNKGVEELGYEHYMKQLDNIIVQYDPKNKDFYIGDKDKTFLLTRKGMTEIPQHPSAVWRANGSTYMIPDIVDEYYQTIVTQPFDMGYGGQKTIFEIETDLAPTSYPEVAVDYYNKLSTNGTTSYIPLNNQNLCSIIASGNAFAVRIRTEPVYEDTRIGYIKVRYKMTDLRGIRGIYAPPIRGQR